MKVVWLFPPSKEGGFPNVSQYRFFKRMPIRISIIYPYLAAMGATLLQRIGFEVDFLDCPTMNLSWNDITPILQKADIVVMEARTPMMFEIWKVCSFIHELFPGVKIVLYGDHVSWNPEESLQKGADIIVKGGDYDVGVLRVCQALRKNSNAKRIFDIQLIPDLDVLPFCDRDLVPWQLYYETWRHREKFVWTMSSRGCYYKCIFCAWAGCFWDNRLRQRSTTNVANEYQQLFNDVGDCEVLDDADLFDTNWGGKFAKEWLSRGFRKEVLWAFQTHPNMIKNIDNLKLLRKAGLRTVKLGIEDGNNISLSRMGKATTIQIVERAIGLLKEANIMVHANLVVGWPWNTKKDAYDKIDWIKKLDPNQAQFSLLIPYPWTELYDMAKSNGWLLVKPGEWNRFDASAPMLKMVDLSPAEIVQLYKDCWKKFYFDPKYIIKHILKVRHLEGVKQLFRGFRAIRHGHMRAVQ